MVTKFKEVGEMSCEDIMMNNNTRMSGKTITSTFQHHDDLQFCHAEVTMEEVTSARSLTKTSGNSFLDSELKAAKWIKKTPLNFEKIGTIMMDDTIVN